MKTVTLQELRTKWENGFKVILEIPDFTRNTIPANLERVIVVLKDDNGYHMNRYFPITGLYEESWFISVDISKGSAADILKGIETLFPDGAVSNLI